MPFIPTQHDAQIFYKDWGQGQPVVFSHGWPLSADAWDSQMLFLAGRGYRVIAHDRRGHGRSSQTWAGNDMDTYADDLAAVFDALDLQDAVLVGHSTGGGEVARYIGRHGSTRLAKAVLLGAVPPIMLKTAANPAGLPMEVFDAIRASVLKDRAQFDDALLRLQPRRRRNFRRRARLLLAAGHASEHQGGLRLHQAIFGDGFHRGPEEIRYSNADRAWRRRSDRSDRRSRDVVVKACERREAQNLPRRAAWSGDDLAR
jgi:pimeloyl-ACP methyl ester carboxylesterase